MYLAKSPILRYWARCLAGCAAALIFVVMQAGCASTSGLPDSPSAPYSEITHMPAPSDVDVQKIVADPDVQMVAGANNDFGFRLLNKLDQNPAGQNTFFSPLSISSALMMTWNGAAGQTADEMAKTLGLPSVAKPSDANRGYSLLLPYLRNPDDKVELSIANALWVKKDLRFAPAFQQACEQNYGAQTTSLDLGSQSGIDAINSWVNQNTHGKIPTIIDSPPDPSMMAVLTDAIYFHGKWNSPFEKSATQTANFTLEGGATKQVPMMSEEHDFSYMETPQYQAISLPYGSGRVSMYILLPKNGTMANDLVTSLNVQAWDHLMQQLSTRDVLIYLPRFHADYSQSLGEALESLGMVTAFGSNADFTQMGFKDAYISYVLHKATLDVDEEGTVAAAATAVGVAALSAKMVAQPIVMRVDHPFFCAICDNDSRTILFEGVIRNPGTVTTPTSDSP